MKPTRELMDAALEAAEQKLERAYGSAPLCDEVCEELLGTDKDKWFMAHDRDELKAFYERKLPAIRESARKLGYALGVHGSMLRDLDLIAAPWNGEAADKDALAHAIAIAACGITRDGPYQWTRKSESRFAVSIPVCWTAREETNAGHIDLSVFVYPWSSITESDYVSLVAALRAGVNVNYEAADAIVQLQTERDALAEDVEQLRVQLAGCGVIAGSNTKDSLARAMPGKDAYGYSASLADVERCVRREIALRAERDALREEVSLRRHTMPAEYAKLLAQRDYAMEMVNVQDGQIDALRGLLKVARDCIYSLDAREIYADELTRIDAALAKDKP